MDFNSYKKLFQTVTISLKLVWFRLMLFFRRKYCPGERNRVHGSKSIP